MAFTINPDDHEPIFSQIVNEVVFGILRGVWREGEQIPSRREMAERLRVNPNTVLAAYRQLESLGVAEVRRGLGLFVSEGGVEKSKKLTAQILKKRFGDLLALARRAGLTDEEISAMLNELAGKSAGGASNIRRERGE